MLDANVDKEKVECTIDADKKSHSIEHECMISLKSSELNFCYLGCKN